MSSVQSYREWSSRISVVTACQWSHETPDVVTCTMTLLTAITILFTWRLLPGLLKPTGWYPLAALWVCEKGDIVTARLSVARGIVAKRCQIRVWGQQTSIRKPICKNGIWTPFPDFRNPTKMFKMTILGKTSQLDVYGTWMSNVELMTYFRMELSPRAKASSTLYFAFKPTNCHA